MNATVDLVRTSDAVALGVEDCGDPTAPLVLLVGAPTMLSWPDELCESLARNGRHVVRCDLRDAGTSTTENPEDPAYTLRDLAADAVSLARILAGRPAQLAGIGVGGMVAHVAALDHPDAFSALTLAGTRPVAPGPVDPHLHTHVAVSNKVQDGERRWPHGWTRPFQPRKMHTTSVRGLTAAAGLGLASWRSQCPRFEQGLLWWG